MEKQEENRMILELDESEALCDWLLERGIGLEEAAHVLCSLNNRETLGSALLEVFKNRKLNLGHYHGKNISDDWGNPITP